MRLVCYRLSLCLSRQSQSYSFLINQEIKDRDLDNGISRRWDGLLLTDPVVASTLIWSLDMTALARPFQREVIMLCFPHLVS
jgi:hypothetical protein